MNDARFDHMPLVLETPPAESEVHGYRSEISLLYSLIDDGPA
jgi:endonuclease IV